MSDKKLMKPPKADADALSGPAKPDPRVAELEARVAELEAELAGRDRALARLQR